MVGDTGKRLAVIARMDDSGLGHQTRDLVRLLRPDKVIAIDFTFYNKFKQHPEWYKDFDTTIVNGFIPDWQVTQIAQDVDIVLTAETFYNNNFVDICNNVGVITLNQINYEFFEPLQNQQLLLPTKILMPSYWKFEEMKSRTIAGKTVYLPPPLFLDDYAENRDINMARKGRRRYLHVAGKMAAHDRAGTMDLLNSLKFSHEDFELVIKVQAGETLTSDDPRVTFDYSFPEDERELYRDFDAMIQPRRYAGLNLPMNEALASGLPVLMTNIEPNNKVLPSYWLVESYKVSQFFARTPIEVYSADLPSLGKLIDKVTLQDDQFLLGWKTEAYLIAKREFDHTIIYQKFAGLIKQLGV